MRPTLQGRMAADARIGKHSHDREWPAPGTTLLFSTPRPRGREAAAKRKAGAPIVPRQTSKTNVALCCTKLCIKTIGRYIFLICFDITIKCIYVGI